MISLESSKPLRPRDLIIVGFFRCRKKGTHTMGFAYKLKGFFISDERCVFPWKSERFVDCIEKLIVRFKNGSFWPWPLWIVCGWMLAQLITAAFHISRSKKSSDPDKCLMWAINIEIIDKIRSVGDTFECNCWQFWRAEIACSNVLKSKTDRAESSPIMIHVCGRFYQYFWTF